MKRIDYQRLVARCMALSHTQDHTQDATWGLRWRLVAEYLAERSWREKPITYIGK